MGMETLYKIWPECSLLRMNALLNTSQSAVWALAPAGSTSTRTRRRWTSGFTWTLRTGYPMKWGPKSRRRCRMSSLRTASSSLSRTGMRHHVKYHERCNLAKLYLNGFHMRYLQCPQTGSIFCVQRGCRFTQGVPKRLLKRRPILFGVSKIENCPLAKRK